jgi:hypothetical protein
VRGQPFQTVSARTRACSTPFTHGAILPSRDLTYCCGIPQRSGRYESMRLCTQVFEIAAPATSTAFAALIAHGTPVRSAILVAPHPSLNVK